MKRVFETPKLNESSDATGMNEKGQSNDPLRNTVLKWIDSRFSDCCFPHEDWNPLQLLSSLDCESDLASVIMSAGYDLNRATTGHVTPSLSPLHIAVSTGRYDIVDQLIKFKCDLNLQDKYGFTALHYAVVKRNNEMILLLIAGGAQGNAPSSVGSTPLDLAQVLKYTEIEDILNSQLKTEIDPSLPKFKEWLCHLGAGEYVSKFLAAGYDLPFIVKAGLVEADLDCVGIPMSKLGIRRKLLMLHNLRDFCEESVEDDDDDEEEEDSEQSKDSDERSEEESEND
jgi:Ankyrin repeats (3 copies)/SAM domain (Sterile alpha motif)